MTGNQPVDRSMHVIRRSKHEDRVSIHMGRIIKQTFRIRRHVEKNKTQYS
jgi:hypothetical protein